MLKIREKARKYHFLPRKSIFGLRKNSTLKPSINLIQRRPRGCNPPEPFPLPRLQRHGGRKH